MKTAIAIFGALALMTGTAAFAGMGCAGAKITKTTQSSPIDSDEKIVVTTPAPTEVAN